MEVIIALTPCKARLMSVFQHKQAQQYKVCHVCVCVCVCGGGGGGGGGAQAPPWIHHGMACTI